ncbi:hypothetical protein PsYK624_105900 [Phanerochaete sordida]|uniref:Uncharacterized protein n=1 Tax=Phanerochaete sordida TaxID=48140 RepID=A0A9P3LGC5_9APHY|nr:hypothetical protein PsYK624_105900 [Phanerochaete sordida]
MMLERIVLNSSHQLQPLELFLDGLRKASMSQADVRWLWTVTLWATYDRRAAASPMRLLEHMLLSPLAHKLHKLETLSCSLSRNALWSHDEVPRRLDGTSFPPRISQAAPALLRPFSSVKSLRLSSRRFGSFRDLIRFLGALRGLESVYLEEVCWPDEGDTGQEVTMPRWIRRPEGLQHLSMVDRLCHKDTRFITFLCSLFVNQLALPSEDAEAVLHTIRHSFAAVTWDKRGEIDNIVPGSNSLFEISLSSTRRKE